MKFSRPGVVILVERCNVENVNLAIIGKMHLQKQRLKIKQNI